jgi:hypothetical protein
MTTLKICIIESQISFIVRKLLCRNEVNPKCPNVSTLNLNMLPFFYKICIQSWSKLQELIQLCNNDIDSILKTRIFI